MDARLRCPFCGWELWIPVPAPGSATWWTCRCGKQLAVTPNGALWVCAHDLEVVEAARANADPDDDPMVRRFRALDLD